MSGWALKEAEESCNTVFERALAGEPQLIMRGRKPALLVVSVQFGDVVARGGRRTIRRAKRRTLYDVMCKCPIRDDEVAELMNFRNQDAPSYFERSGGFADD